MKILLIDDSLDLGFLIRMSLKPHAVTQVFTLEEAQKRVGFESFDLFLIDVSLPDGDGFRLCSEFSKDSRWTKIPKILLTAKSDTEDKVFGFNCGADDYITKPFHHSELKARVEARLRAIPSGVAYIWEGFEFDGQFQKCWWTGDGAKIDLGLTPTEYRLLYALALGKGTPLSREEIITQVWKNNGTAIEIRGIDAHIVHLRRKLGPEGARILSVYGKGYALAEKVSDRGSQVA